MFSSFYRLAGLLLTLGVCLGAKAQGASQASVQPLPETSHLEQVPRVPGVGTLLRGLNAGLSFSGVHDSSVGWYDVTTPAVSYTFSPHYSADASLSIYPYRLVQNQNPQIAQRLLKATGEVGDTLIGVHGSFNPSKFWNTTTASFTLPTGNSTDGLSTGKVTFDFSNRLERYAKRTGLLVDLGIGDSSGLFNSVVGRNYNSLGPLAHFQTGVVLLLPGRSYVQSVAYEQLPLGSQTIYTALGPPGSPAQPPVSGSGMSEDNGFTTTFDIPLNAHLAISSYYNRSLRHRLDTVSIGVTYVLRGIPGKKRLSLIDRALREAESANP